MKFRIVLEYDAEAQAFSAVCPELPGCASAGDTEEEAKQNIREAIELYLAPSDMELSRDAKVDGGLDLWVIAERLTGLTQLQVINLTLNGASTDSFRARGPIWKTAALPPRSVWSACGRLAGHNR